MKPELVVFDCDGVLVDTEPVTNDVLVTDLNARGLTLSHADAIDMFVGGTMDGVMRTARAMGGDIPDNWLDVIYGKMFDALGRGVPVIDGVHDLLDRLDAEGVAVAVASNGPMAKMEISLGPSGLWDRLAGRILSREDHAPKPDPAMILHAIKMAGAAKDRTIMIDDMPQGCLAAKAAGVHCLGYGADGDPARFDGTGAKVITSLREVPRLIGLDR